MYFWVLQGLRTLQQAPKWGSSSKEVCCLPGSQAKDVTRRHPFLVQPSDPLLFLHVGWEEVATCNLRTIKTDFRELGWMIRNSGVQVIFFSILPSIDSVMSRRIVSINMWFHGWCHHQNFRFLGDRKFYIAPGLLASDRIYLYQRGKKVLGHEWAGFIDRTLN